MTEYTAGFAFASIAGGRSVALIHKLHGPKGVVGRKNAIGGKIESDEEPVQCQRREFLEETGVDIPEERWTHTVTLEGHNNGGWVVHFFKAELTYEEAAALRSTTDEVVSLYGLDTIHELNVVPNVLWLMPMQLDRHLAWPITLREADP